MRFALLAAAAAFMFTSSAFADTTPYQPVSASRAHYGYDETRIEYNRLRVSFAGNTDTDRETVETYLLYRAAETTLQHGYDYFIVIDHDVDTTTEFQASGPPLPPIAPRRYTQEARHHAVSEIIMLHGVRPARANAFDARAVMANLHPRIERP